MLRLSGFELYCRWVPLTAGHILRIIHGKVKKADSFMMPHQLLSPGKSKGNRTESIICHAFRRRILSVIEHFVATRISSVNSKLIETCRSSLLCSKMLGIHMVGNGTVKYSSLVYFPFSSRRGYLTTQELVEPLTKPKKKTYTPLSR